jgi:hypothetical protein
VHVPLTERIDPTMTKERSLAVLDTAVEPEEGLEVIGGEGARVPAVATNWPRTACGRLICTPERPMPQDARKAFGGSALWQHSDVEDIGECSDGCCDRKRCKSCGVRWLASYGR